MAKAYSYLRFSTPEQRKGDSFKRQADLATDYAVRHGLELDASLTLHDLGVSAFRGRNAKTGALRSFLDAVHDGLIAEGSYLLVESLDRITRDAILAAQGLFLEIIDAGVVLVTLTDQRAYSRTSINANPTDLIISLVSMMRAHDESAIKSRRLRASWISKRDRAASKKLTARGPAWLTLDKTTDDWVTDPARVAIVQRIFRMSAEGTGENLIATTLNREAVPPMGGGAHWHRSSVTKILRNPAVKGTLVPHVMSHEDGKRRRTAQAPVEDYFPSIVDPDLYQAVSALREAPNPRRGRHAALPLRNILAGLARCTRCGGSMIRVAKGNARRAGRPHLVCTRAKAGAGCEYRSVRLDLIEAAIVNSSAWLVTQAPIADGDWFWDEAGKLGRQMEAVDVQIDRLASAIASEPESKAVMATLRDRERSKDELQASLNRLIERYQGYSPIIVERRLAELQVALAKDPFDIPAANLALRSLAERVVVDLDREVLRFEWRWVTASELPYRGGLTPD